MNKEICDCPKCKRKPTLEWKAWKNLDGKIEHWYSACCKIDEPFIPPAETPEGAIAKWNATVLSWYFSEQNTDRIGLNIFRCPACDSAIDYEFLGVFQNFPDFGSEKRGYGILLKCTNPECFCQRDFDLQEIPGLFTEWIQFTAFVKDGIMAGRLNYSKKEAEK